MVTVFLSCLLVYAEYPASSYDLCNPHHQQGHCNREIVEQLEVEGVFIFIRPYFTHVTQIKLCPVLKTLGFEIIKLQIKV